MLSFLLFQQIAQLFIIIFLGWLLVKTGLLKSEDSRCLSMVLLYIITPCVFINAFQIQHTPEILSMMAFSTGLALMCNVLLILLGRLSACLLHLDVVEEASVSYPNSGNMAIPLVSAIFGAEWVVFVALYNMIQNLFVWTHARIFISGERKLSLRKILCNVNILAIIAGGLLFFLNIQLPEIVQGALTSVGNTIGPVAMLIVGMLIAGLKPEELRNYRRIWKPVLFRLVILPLVIVLLARVLPISALNEQSETLTLIALVPTFAPSANMVPQFSQIYGRDAKYASLINALTMLCCIVTMPLLIALYQM